MKYVALLRGINVGGNNIIAKEDLKACFESLGFTAVKTYIQSGNILFQSPEKSVSKLTKQIEAGLSKRFSYDAQAVVYSDKTYHAILASAPKGWGTTEDQKHNVLFVLGDNTPADIAAMLPPQKPDIEKITVGKQAVFWSISKEDQTKTSYMKLPGTKPYKLVTIRNQNTAFKLQTMLEEMAS